MSPLGHSIVVVVLGGELDRYLLQDIHVRDDLVTEVLDRVEPNASLTTTAMQSPRDIVLHAEPFDRLEGALSARTDPLARIAEELALEVALPLTLTEGCIPGDREGNPVIPLAEASVGRIALSRMGERQSLHDRERCLDLHRADRIAMIVAVVHASS